MGFVRDAVLSRTFTGDAVAIVDTYFAAFRPSDFLFQTCIMAALGTVLVPVLASHKAHQRPREMSAVLSGSMLLGSMLFGAIALLLGLALPWVAHWFVAFEGDQLRLYVQFGRIALLSNFLFVFGNTLGQYLITEQRYWVYGITPVLYTLGTILGTLLLTPVLGPYGPITGTVCATALYVCLRLWAAVRAGFRPSLVLWHPEFASMLRLMLPRVLSLGAMQVQLLAFDRFASHISPGAIAINSFARNFQSVLVGVTGIAMAQSAYSLLGQSAAWGNRRLFQKYLVWGVGALLVITVPGSVVLVWLSPLVASVMGIELLSLFSATLLVYAFSIPCESMNHLLLRAYYATKQTLVPALAAVANALAAIGTAWFFAQRWGVEGLALGFVVGQATLLLLLLLLLPGVLARVQAAQSHTTNDA